jgi:acyl-coenzyme A thioesterase PaaI-like protein
MPVVMTIPELDRFLAAEFPQVFHPDSGLAIEALWDHGCRVRQVFRDGHIRPGGTVSGPTMMALADFAMYVAVLAAIGPVPLAVTINLNINFLRKPAQRDLVAEAQLLKLASGSRPGKSPFVPTARTVPLPMSRRPIRSRRIALDLSGGIIEP